MAYVPLARMGRLFNSTSFVCNCYFINKRVSFLSNCWEFSIGDRTRMGRLFNSSSFVCNCYFINKRVIFLSNCWEFRIGDRTRMG